MTAQMTNMPEASRMTVALMRSTCRCVAFQPSGAAEGFSVLPHFLGSVPDFLKIHFRHCTSGCCCSSTWAILILRIWHDLQWTMTRFKDAILHSHRSDWCQKGEDCDAVLHKTVSLVDVTGVRTHLISLCTMTMSVDWQLYSRDLPKGHSQASADTLGGKGM